ncbi:MAG: hypothetical protein EOO17_03315 [Chloroflexi bacterium]|nr:MAG: hypothetical protein EOO17_03315 [Chloroflexota bacterium]
MSTTPLNVARRQVEQYEPLVRKIEVPLAIQNRDAHPQQDQLEKIEQVLKRKRDSHKVVSQVLSNDREQLCLWIIPGKKLVVSRNDRFHALRPGLLSGAELDMVLACVKKL